MPASAGVAGAASLAPVAPGVPSHGRAWELVTPPEAMTAVPGAVMAISPSGDRLAYQTAGAMPGAPFGGFVTFNLATREPAGWSNVPLGYPEAEFLVNIFGGGERPVAFDQELATSVWKNGLEPPAGYGLFRSQPGGYELLADMGDSGAFIAASPDLQRIVFKSDQHLLPADAARVAGSSIYEVVGSTLQLVDVDDGGALLSECGGVSGGRAWVSRDGLRIFLSTIPCTGVSDIYMRTGNDTTEISAPQCIRPECGEEQSPVFMAAAPSGSSAFFVTAQPLTEDDLDLSSDLYRYDVGSGELTLVSVGAPVSVSAAQPLRISDDGSRVYFVAAGELIPGEGAPTGPNLYVTTPTGPRFVAAVGSGELEISGDGRYALFPTSTPLRPEDTDERQDLYVYDATGETLGLVTAGPGGSGNGPFDVELPELKPVSTHPFGHLSNDGTRVAFQTAEQLVPQDDNEKPDVYEWVDGSLGLVSPGTADQAATYAGMTPDGQTIVFDTAATLLGRDRDGGDTDLYGARIGGGLAEPVVPPECEERSCAAASGPATARRPAPGAHLIARIGLAPIGAAARRQLRRRGWTTLLAEVPVPGLLSARGEARIGARQRPVALGSVEAKQGGPVRLRLRLTRPARESLAAGDQLRVRLTLRLAAAGAAHTSFVLGGAR